MIDRLIKRQKGQGREDVGEWIQDVVCDKWLNVMNKENENGVDEDRDDR